MISKHDAGASPSVGRRMAIGATWTVAFRLVGRFLGLISTLFLARLLVPADFGIVAMAMTLIAGLEVFKGLGFETALIRDHSATRTAYDTAWTLNVLLGLASGLVMVLLARQAAEFFKEPRLVPVIWSLAPLPIIDGLWNVGCVDFRKHLNFRSEFELEVLRKLVSVLTVVPLAFLWRDYWSLVIGQIVGRIAGVALSYKMSPFRPRWSVVAHGDLLRFSGWLFANNILSFLRLRMANFVLGRLSGSAALGTYSIAQEIAALPSSNLVAPINRAVYPGYAKMATDPSALRSGVEQVVGGIALFVFPASVGIMSLAHLIVPVMLGNKWLETVPLIQVLAIFGATVALQSNIQAMYNAIGKPHYQVSMTATVTAVLLPLLWVLSQRYGALGAAYANLITGLLVVPVNYIVACRLIGLKLGRIAVNLWRPAVCAVLMAAVLYLLFPPVAAPRSTRDAALLLFVGVAIGVVVYSGSSFVLWMLAGKPPGAERFVLNRVKDLLHLGARRLNRGG